ncbi:MAG TPA: peptidylprolyl isomerase [Porticoccaceae bacterium]|nr:peptidylprolyl isomerase [Porticoccaceae bacterium]
MTTQAETINSSSRVTMHFSLALGDGTLVDSNFEGQPASFTMGDGSLLPGFEQCLLGLKAEDQRSFTVEAAQGFGLRKTENILSVKRSDFAPDMTLSPGLVVSFADPSGGEMPGVITTFDEQKVEVDFNHPLAGKTLCFEVRIVAVEKGEEAGGAVQWK